jgi:hypothetical protein
MKRLVLGYGAVNECVPRNRCRHFRPVMTVTLFFRFMRLSGWPPRLVGPLVWLAPSSGWPPRLVGPLVWLAPSSEEAGVPRLFPRSESKTRSSEVVASA